MLRLCIATCIHGKGHSKAFTWPFDIRGIPDKKAHTIRYIIFSEAVNVIQSLLAEFFKHFYRAFDSTNFFSKWLTVSSIKSFLKQMGQRAKSQKTFVIPLSFSIKRSNDVNINGPKTSQIIVPLCFYLILYYTQVGPFVYYLTVDYILERNLMKC